MYAERTILTKKNNEILNSVSSVFNNTFSWKLFVWAHIHQAYYYHNFYLLAEFFMGNFQIENQDRIILMLVYPDPEEVCILEWDSPRLKLCYLRLWLFLFLSKTLNSVKTVKEEFGEFEPPLKFKLESFRENNFLHLKVF